MVIDDIFGSIAEAVLDVAGSVAGEVLVEAADVAVDGVIEARRLRRKYESARDCSGYQRSNAKSPDFGRIKHFDW